MVRRLALGMLPLLLVFACSSSDASPGGTELPTERPKPTPLPALADAKTTSEITLVPTGPQQSFRDGPNPGSNPAALVDYLSRGFGDLAPGPGEAFVTRVIDASTPPAAGPNAKRLVRFTHLADLQLADDESPTRLGQFDGVGATSSALRPQDADLCRMANAAVRTINALHRKDPIAFTILGGDNADSAQTNEVDWALGILSGGVDVKCDSGNDDDLIPGPGNDGKDPFVAEGLAMPWRWVTGNHDVLVQGNLPVNDGTKQAAIGDFASGGTRDYTQGGAIVAGSVVADPKRALLSRSELMAKIAGDKDGHGIGASERGSGRATYTFDVEGTALRFLVIDTAHESGGSEGVITQREVGKTIKPLLDKAQADGKWVILASHHATTSLTEDGGAFGEEEPDALTTEAWQTFVGQYSNVVFSMVGHSHENRVRPVVPPAVPAPGQGSHAWWEVMTAAIADFPHQFRVVEIFDQDNGWLMLRTSAVDFAVDGDPVANDGRRAGVVDVRSGWLPTGAGEPGDRNVELWIKKP